MLHLAVEDAEWLAEDLVPDDPNHRRLPEYDNDREWDVWSEDLFQDHDVLMLYEDQLDRIEDPDSDTNRHMRLGDLRPTSWFTWFANAKPRSPGRGFLR